MSDIPQALRAGFGSRLVTAYHGQYPNFGDQLTPLLLDHYGWRAVFRHYKPRFWPTPPEIVSVGTLLQNTPREYDGLILGTGSDHVPLEFPDARVLALRGKLSLENLHHPPKDIVLGDPGLLVSRAVQHTATSEFDLGIIPHFVDKDHEIIRRWVSRFRTRALLIDVQHSPLRVLRQLLRCKHVISSSLHGLVCADSFDVPNARFVIRETITEDMDYKYLDYYSAFPMCHQVHVAQGDETLAQLVGLCSYHGDHVAPVAGKLHQLFSSLGPHLQQLRRRRRANRNHR